MATRIERLEREAKQAEERARQKKARLAAERRKHETTRKIIYGAATLKLCESDPALAARIESQMSGRDRQRLGIDRPRVPLGGSQTGEESDQS